MKFFSTIIFLFVISFLTAQEESFASKIDKHRDHYKQDFLKDERAPLEEEDFKFLRFYEASKDLEVTCKVTLTTEAQPFELPTYSGITKTFRKYAHLDFEIEGKMYQLSAYQNLKSLQMPMYRTHLFIPFKDHTNSEATYGGGRYIDLDIKDIKNNEVVLDFNKSYNPWCAYSDGYNCPIPPSENHLDISILAGEMMYVGPKKKRK